ncbi:MAG TPA: hypothetical protein VFZ53_33450 [Polyangiaceae bacterium]
MPLGRVFSFAFTVTVMFACASEANEPDPEPAGPDPVETEVLERCSDFAARLCASAASCCESTVGTFSAERCASSFVAEFCRPAAAVVAEGRAEYRPEAEEPCLAAWTRAHATCLADWEEIVAVRREVWAECKMVRGTAPIGSGCSTPSTCEQPEGAATARCLPDPLTRTPTCQVLEILPERATCPYPNGEVSVCDVGLYCTTTERDVNGTCTPIVPSGEACDADVPLNPECGLGSYCGLDDGLCHRATNFGGSGCAQATECVSFDCRMSASGGTCTDALSTAADLCERGAS